MSMFEAGQVWTYHCRPGEEVSRLVVLKVESDADVGTIVHVRVEGLRLRNPLLRGGYADTVSHMPFTETALLPGVLTLERTLEKLPNFEAEYAVWRKQFDKGESGAWTVSLLECLNNLEAAMNSPG